MHIDPEPSWAWDGLDHSSAAGYLAGCLPGADPDRLEPFGQGDFCLAFREGSQVIRIARHADAAAAIRREACVLAQIGGMLPLPVPRLTFYSPQACPPFTVHEIVAGEELTREDWETLPLPAQERAAADLADFLRALHSIPVETVRNCGLARLDAALLARDLREAAAGTIREFLHFTAYRQLDETLEIWSRSSKSNARPLALLHCDIGPGHLLYDPRSGGLTGVIDFGDITVGDPARDFIYIYEDFGPKLLKMVLDRYAGGDAQRWMPEIRKWYLLEAVSWTVEQHRGQHRDEMELGLAEIRRELAERSDFAEDQNALL